MYGLRAINNMYVASSTGRNSIITGSGDFRNGKLSVTGSGNRGSFADLPCVPRKRLQGPKKPGKDRLGNLSGGDRALRPTGPQTAYSLPHLAAKWSTMPGASEFRRREAGKREGVEPLEGWASNASWSENIAKETTKMLLRKVASEPTLAR
eukprot:TRINITY_DN26651_c0_g1_i1.p1 TRINITY_DN26651_c0_g1~~TRINITY_DN26651_c0_g1_i1.p1  ORF type:complete len:151 (+),score=16.26 TRINITY_DN26651_c0_g1_i1:77-529(+)